MESDQKNDAVTLKSCTSCNAELPLDKFPKKGSGRIESNCKNCFNLKRKNNRVPVRRWSILNLPIRIYLSEIKSRWIDCLFNLLCEYDLLLATEEDLDVDVILNRCSKIQTMIA